MSNILPVLGLWVVLQDRMPPLTCFAVPVLPYLPRALPSHCTVGDTLTGLPLSSCVPVAGGGYQP